MTSLIACLSTGKGTWIEVLDVIAKEEWEKIYVVTNEFGKEKFKCPKECDLIVVNPEKHVKALSEDIRKALDGKINDLEVAVNMSSGSGKEHMAMISAILKLGFAVRYVAVEDDILVEV